jgi:hypothetical protein
MARTVAFGDLQAGTPLPPLALAISAAANDRYWDGAGVEHPLRAAGALYPLIAANLTVLAFGGLYADPVIQARQRLVCHRRADAPETLHTTGEVTEQYARRGRSYVVINTTVALDDGQPLWSSTVVFTPAATL